jgi:hypothetical protein
MRRRRAAVAALVAVALRVSGAAAERQDNNGGGSSDQGGGSSWSTQECAYMITEPYSTTFQDASDPFWLQTPGYLCVPVARGLRRWGGARRGRLGAAPLRVLHLSYTRRALPGRSAGVARLVGGARAAHAARRACRRRRMPPQRLRARASAGARATLYAPKTTLTRARRPPPPYVPLRNDMTSACGKGPSFCTFAEPSLAQFGAALPGGGTGLAMELSQAPCVNTQLCCANGVCANWAGAHLVSNGCLLYGTVEFEASISGLPVDTNGVFYFGLRITAAGSNPQVAQNEIDIGMAPATLVPLPSTSNKPHLDPNAVADAPGSGPELVLAYFGPAVSIGAYGQATNPAFTPALADAFTTYRMEWGPGSLDYFVNGQLYRSVRTQAGPGGPGGTAVPWRAQDLRLIVRTNSGLADPAPPGTVYIRSLTVTPAGQSAPAPGAAPSAQAQQQAAPALQQAPQVHEQRPPQPEQPAAPEQPVRPPPAPAHPAQPSAPPQPLPAPTHPAHPARSPPPPLAPSQPEQPPQPGPQLQPPHAPSQPAAPAHPARSPPPPHAPAQPDQPPQPAPKVHTHTTPAAAVAQPAPGPSAAVEAEIASALAAAQAKQLAAQQAQQAEQAEQQKLQAEQSPTQGQQSQEALQEQAAAAQAAQQAQQAAQQQQQAQLQALLLQEQLAREAPPGPSFALPGQVFKPTPQQVAAWHLAPAPTQAPAHSGGSGNLLAVAAATAPGVAAAPQHAAAAPLPAPHAPALAFLGIRDAVVTAAAPAAAASLTQAQPASSDAAPEEQAAAPPHGPLAWLFPRFG